MQKLIQLALAILTLGAAVGGFHFNNLKNEVEIPYAEPPSFQAILASQEARDAHFESARARDAAYAERRELGLYSDNLFGVALLSALALILASIPWKRIALASGEKAGEAYDKITDLNEKRKQAKGPNLSHSKGINTFLVADELAKWRKLLDDGTVTQSEYDAVKAKLLGQNRKEES